MTDESANKRVQVSEVIDCCCSVARVRSACRSILNKDILKIRTEIDSKTGKDGSVSWSKLSKDTQKFLNEVASGVKVKDGEKVPVPKGMNNKDLTALARVRSFKVSQFANVAVTCSVDFVIQKIVQLAMITAKESGKNNILPTHIVNDALRTNEVFALIYNLDIIKSHDSVLEKHEEDRLQKITDKVTAKVVAKEARRVKREEDKKTAKKAAPKKSAKGKDKGKNKEAAAPAPETSVEPPATSETTAPAPETSVEPPATSETTAPAKIVDAVAKKKSTKKTTTEVVAVKKPTEKKDGEVGGEYMYYIDKIISVQKKKLGDDYKNMRASAYMRSFCSNTITQLIARMTNMFSILAKSGSMKTITDKIVSTAIDIILVDARGEYPELISAVNNSVEVYRKYRSEKEKSIAAGVKPVDDDDDEDE
jgi:hypothetical protein